MTRVIAIIPAEILDSVREAALGVFGEVAAASFVPAGSATGEAPITHWWMAGVFNDSDYASVLAMRSAFPSAHVESYDLGANPSRPQALLAEMGLKPLITTLL